MTPKCQAAINLSWFFIIMPLLQQVSTDQMFITHDAYDKVEYCTLSFGHPDKEFLKVIDRMHKWRPKMYSFVYVLIRLTSLALK